MKTLKEGGLQGTWISYKNRIRGALWQVGIDRDTLTTLVQKTEEPNQGAKSCLNGMVRELLTINELRVTYTGV